MAKNEGVEVSVAGPSPSLFLSKAEDCVRFKFGMTLELMIGLIDFCTFRQHIYLDYFLRWARKRIVLLFMYQ